MKFAKNNDPQQWRLEKLSNELLDAAYDPTSREIAMMGGKLSPEGLQEVGGEAAAEKLRAEGSARIEMMPDVRLSGRLLLHGEIKAAFEENDMERAVILAGPDLELLRLAAATYKRGRGQQKKRPRDPKPHRVTLLEDLWSEIDLLCRLWKQYNMNVEAPKETARKIVARRLIRTHGATGFENIKKVLKNFYKNRARRHR